MADDFVPKILSHQHVNYCKKIYKVILFALYQWNTKPIDVNPTVLIFVNIFKVQYMSFICKYLYSFYSNHKSSNFYYC